MNSKTKPKWKKTMKIIGITMLVIGVLIVINMTMNTIANKANTDLAASFEAVKNENAIIPQKDDDGNWTFTTDRELKVLQFTDIHIGGGWLSAEKDAKAINAVAAMITAEKPDLVIVTGDIVYPVPYESAAINNLPPAKVFATLMETLGVYWVPTFGNHDTEFYSFYSREKISEYYSSDELKYCLFQRGDENVDGFGNTVVNVKNSQGIITQSIFTLDSHAYEGKGLMSIINMKYDNLHQNQIDWYKATVEKNSKYNRELIEHLSIVSSNSEFDKDGLLEKYGNVNSMLFFHIPIQEYGDAWFKYVKNDYQDTDDIKLIYGTAGETGEVIYCGVHPDELFETMQAMEGKKAIFCGHDHLNNFSIDYKGIRLTYGMSIDYLAYSGIAKLGSQRGCTVITIKPDGNFECSAENYYQDKYQVLTGVKEDVTMQDLNLAD